MFDKNSPLGYNIRRKRFVVLIFLSNYSMLGKQRPSHLDHHPSYLPASVLPHLIQRHKRSSDTLCVWASFVLQKAQIIAPYLLPFLAKNKKIFLNSQKSGMKSIKILTRLSEISIKIYRAALLYTK